MTERTDSERAQLEAAFDRVWGNPSGLRALTIVNHTAIGLRFMLTGGLFFLLAGLLAMLMRAQLAVPDQDFLTPEVYNQLFSMHGTMMMFLFAVPMLEGLAVYLIPKMIGARDLVFPRLSAFGYFCYLFGGLILLSSLVLGLAPDSGWFMYTPLSSKAASPGPNADFWLLGITFVEISAVAAGVELIVSILRTRTAGMALSQMPLFAWFTLATAGMILVGFPPLILGSILLELERALDFPFFDASRGGDPLLWQHLFWLFGHPEVYIIFLPAAGIIATIVPVFAGRPIVGYRWNVFAALAIAFLSFGLWVHHMYTVGIPHLAQSFFSVASMLVSVPMGILVFSWLATLLLGRPRYRLPMLWLLGFLVIFVAGGLTGVMVALAPFDWQVHDTHFVVAHLHYVLVGGMLFPLMAGIYYWLPLVSGRLPSAQLGRWGFWLTFLGFNGTFLIMHWTGLLGMPRRVYTYSTGRGWDWPNLISSIASFVLAAGVAMVVLDLILHWRQGRRADPNPWQADGLEWSLAMPPAPYNFLSLPRSPGRHPLWQRPELLQRIPQGHEGLARISRERRETWGSDAVSGQLREIIHLPGNSWWPFWAACALAVFFIGLLTRLYWLAGLGALAALVLLLIWAWENGGHPRAAPLDPALANGNDNDSDNDNDEPATLPLHSRTLSGPGLWGMNLTLVADGALLLSALFGWFYLWLIAPQWQMPAQSPLPGAALLVAGALLSGAALLQGYLARQLGRGRDRRLFPQLLGVSVLGLLHFGVLLWLLMTAPLSPTATAHDAVIVFLLAYQLFHSGLACLLSGLQAWRVRLNYVSLRLPYEPCVLAPFWYYTSAVFWLIFLALVVFPMTFPMTWNGAP